MMRWSPRRTLGGAALLLSVVACAPRMGPELAHPPPPPVRTTAAIPPDVVTNPIIETVELLARSTTWALGLDSVFVYYGDAGTNELRMIRKGHGVPITIAGAAPRSIALAANWLVWVGSSGHPVLETTLPAAPPVENTEIVLPAGIATAVAAYGPNDVYITQSIGRGGALLHALGTAQLQIASFDAQPLAVALDATHAFVQTEAGLFRVPRGGGFVERLATGSRLSRLVLDDRHAYTTAMIGASRALLRVPKSGGAVTMIEHAVRDAPIAVFGDEVFFLDADQPALRRVRKTGGAFAIVMRAPALWRATALAVDGSGIFLGTEVTREGGGLLAIPLPSREAAAPPEL